MTLLCFHADGRVKRGQTHILFLRVPSIRARGGAKFLEKTLAIMILFDTIITESTLFFAVRSRTARLCTGGDNAEDMQDNPA